MTFIVYVDMFEYLKHKVLGDAWLRLETRITDYALRWIPFATIHENVNFTSCGRRVMPYQNSRCTQALNHCVVLSYLIIWCIFFIFIFAPFLIGFLWFNFFYFFGSYLFYYFPSFLCKALPPYFPHSSYLFYFTFGAHKRSFF